MIRDPSDGSVREEITPQANKINAIAAKSPTEGIMPGFVPGIRQPTRTDAQERLERSREWLKDYQERNAANASRGSNGEELQAAGHSVEDVREAEPRASNLDGADT